jgi:calmodulin-lysine N-methyltransferase
VAVRQRSKGAVTLKDMRDSFATGVDNTGNVCLWPAEEVMAHYILSRASEFEGKNICELGAGVGLCGLAMARALKTNSLLLTDGNAQVVDTLQRALEVPVFCAACLCFSVCVHALVCVCVCRWTHSSAP